ncbi:MAG TPA: NAD(P)H-quinone oxidoreductase [Burkholderiales bacterium]|nr:NAD(P)H-quinone oxidoreductase [Burkholderiales bacterium]
MRAVEISKPGGPEGLAAVERPLPTPKPSEILIKVAAAGVNRPDILQRMGLYPVPPDASDLPGLEVAGEVVAVGSSVKSYRIGDKVCALVHGGGYAEYCVSAEGTALPIPKGLSPVEAASLPETFFTVWGNVYDRAKLAPGESLLVQGGSSGIGVTAIQMARATGNRVFATAGSDEKCAACVRLGAEKAINYKTQDFLAEVKAATGGKGVDVILDMVGGDYTPKNLKLLRAEGRLVHISAMQGGRAGYNVYDIISRRLTITGSTLRSREAAFKTALAAEVEQCVWPLIADGRFRATVFKVYPLQHAADAHRLVAASGHIGKVVLQVVNDEK